MAPKRKYTTKEEVIEAKRISRKKYRDNNIEKVKKQIEIWYSNNPNKSKEYAKNNRESEPHKKKEYTKNWRKNNDIKLKKQRKIYRNTKIKNDYLYKLKENIRCLINISFKNKGFNKNNRKTNEILGCSFEQFKKHLESKFESWMNWNNKALYNGEEGYGWDIDHIIPLCTAKTEEDIIKLNHYTNLQPLCGFTNRVIKRDN